MTNRQGKTPLPRLAALTAALLWLWLPLASSCVARPPHGQKGLTHSAQSLLAMDFGRLSGGRRVRGMQRLPAAAAAEAARTATLGTNLLQKQPLRRELRRTGSIKNALLGSIATEVRRRPGVPAGVVPSRVEFAQNTANNLDMLLRLLGPSRRPLNESSDLSHRTDHLNVRPERTLWQRLRSRLQL